MLKYTGSFDSDDGRIMGGLAPAPGMFAWYKASTEAYANDDPVDIFHDRSGNGNHLTSSGAFRPVFKTGILNGKPVIRFTPLGVFLEMSTAPVGGTTEFTYFIVVGNATGVAFGMALSLQSNASEFAEIRCTGDGVNWSAIGAIGGSPAVNGAVGAPFKILASKYQFDDTIKIFLKDVLQDTQPELNGIEPQNICLAGRGGTPTSFNLLCDMPEVILYPGLLSDPNMTTTANYLAAEYAL